MAIPTYPMTQTFPDRRVTPEHLDGSESHTPTSSRKERIMSPTTFINQGLERVTALLDRLDPQIDGVCEVAGCIHHTHHEPRLTAAGVGTV
jgi:hypothetical protein